MPFQDPASLVIISNLGSDWQVISEQTEEAAEGWDSIKLSLIKDYGNLVVTAEHVAAEWPKGRRIWPDANRRWWVVGCKPKRLAGNVWSIEVQGLGSINGTETPKIRIDTSADSQTINAFLYALSNPSIRRPAILDILRIVPSFTAQYIRIGGGTTNTMNSVGRWGTGYQTPPLPFSFPAPQSLAGGVPDLNGWSIGLGDNSSATIQVNVPSGWYFAGLTADVLTGTEAEGGVRLETETWLNRQALIAT